ncbi:dihydroxyacetone kinase DhaKLM complex PTS-EIIA-like component DhaM [Kitasatospora gansuensis]|uniref:Dihydroxyacetone kinase DhaKLM complex PTS-EIIA-like component DhaM n=1 Tax=Kitasatospora gansuensis TaxID=258050 RepID=A0A7W7SHU5_9ACTN|nr:PTS fructose transporter subunit IIA [Kitasatospora gansuensis]MBB4950755.1 dihydroxyacetone kinase DhaKLM complex PTS-EIIA-like component DhaM [Kitasatospora gansuensis]
MERREDPRADVIPISQAPSAPHPGEPEPEAPRHPRPAGLGRVGVVLVSHSQRLAEAVAALAVGLTTGDPAAVAATGGSLADGLGTSAVLVAAAARRVDQGHGVAVLADLGSAVGTVRALLSDADEHGLPFPVRLADAPFVEGAVAAVATASAGGDLTAVLDAAEEMYRQRKL